MTLTPSGDSSLTVTGVEPNGELQLSVTTSAVTTVRLATVQPPLSCQNAATKIVLSTEVTSFRPPGHRSPPRPVIQTCEGFRPRRNCYTALWHRALRPCGSNDFKVPAFPAASAHPSQPTCTFSATVNDQLGGYSTAATPPANSIFESESPPPADAGMPGWNQFSATTTVATLGFPSAPPGIQLLIPDNSGSRS